MRPAAAISGPEAPGPHALALPPAPADPGRSILLALVGLVVVIGVLGSVAWRVSGGSLFTIATPSMCPDLCVGTLVFDEPVSGPVHVGEVVTFRPPGTSTVFTHRVVKVLPDGSFKTAGDALGAVDPWTVPRTNVIGRVVGNVRGLGWLWRSLPWMAAALACILIARRSVPVGIRKQCDLLFATALVVVPILVMRPLVRASVIVWHQLRHGAVVMTLANTGLLPVQYRVTGAPVVSHVGPGQIVKIAGAPSHGAVVSLRELVSFSTWQWALCGLVVLLPMLACLARFAWVRLRAPRLVLAPAVVSQYQLGHLQQPPTRQPVPVPLAQMRPGYDTGPPGGWYGQDHSTGDRVEPPSRFGLRA